MTAKRKDRVRTLLKGIETGDAAAVAVVNPEKYIQHNPQIPDGLPALRSTLESTSDRGATIEYDRIHRVLAEGNFVLSVSEGSVGGVHSAFYDLFRVADGKLVEHWDIVERIAPRSEWKNDNGKF